MEKQEIETKWDVFKTEKFPEIEDTDLLFELGTIDSIASGCISHYLGGELDRECVEILKQTVNELKKLEPILQLHIKKYFALLREIAQNVIDVEKVELNS